MTGEEYFFAIVDMMVKPLSHRFLVGWASVYKVGRILDKLIKPLLGSIKNGRKKYRIKGLWSVINNLNYS